MKTRDDPYYVTWHLVRARHLKPLRQRYKHPIFLHPAWLADYQTFRRELLAEIGDRPGKGWSLDRIDGARGYEPGNLRWATRQMQSRNRPSYNKIDEAKAAAIRVAYKAGGISQEKLGNLFGITQAHVGQIVRGRIWK